MPGRLLSHIRPVTLIVTSLLWLASIGAGGRSLAQTTSFTYQGKLSDSGAPANGVFDFQFKLFDLLAGGAQQGATLSLNDVTVTDGIFTLQLDFGPGVFPNANRFLEIAVRPGAETGAYTLLGPRQQVTSSPYAIRSLNSTSSDGLSASCVGCVTDSQINMVAGSKIVGQIPTASVPAGSGNYIQNTSGLQAASNFNISGDGTVGGTVSANAVNAATQYNIGGNRVLSVGVAGLNNLFAGEHAGQSNILGGANSFFGYQAGLFNTGGSFNSFYGIAAGRTNTMGSYNAFFGNGAGQLNTTGDSNAFFGSAAGQSNTTGSGNAFFGYLAGQNSAGSNNSFFGSSAGQANNANYNAFFGSEAGKSNSTGQQNSFFGAGAGESNTTGDNNDFFGRLVGHSNTTGFANAFFASGAGGGNTTGSLNAFFGSSAGLQNTTGSHDSFFGRAAGIANTTGSDNTMIGYFADVGSGSLTNATAIGASAFVTASDSIVLGSINGVHGATANTRVGIGLTAPVDRLDVFGNIRVGTGTTGCVRDRDSTVIAGTCSSDIRLKRDVTPFPPMLDAVTRLQPVHFYWKSDEYPDQHFGRSRSFGLIAQEVEKVMPELVGEDEQGYKVVRYNKLSFLLLQAVKDLKNENDALTQRLQALDVETGEIKTQSRLQTAENEELKKRLAAQEARLRRVEQRLARRPKSM